MRALFFTLALLAATPAFADGPFGYGAVPAAQLTGTVPAANGGAGTISGALKGNGSGVVSQAACADLSNAAGTCSSNALSALATQAANTVVANPTSGTAAPVAHAAPSCSAATSALQWTTNTGLGCNSAINAAQLNGATFATPAAIGSGTPAAGTFSTLTATGHVISSGTALSCSDIAFGTGAGTSPTCTSIAGDDHKLRATFSTGTTPATSATILTLTFKSAYAAAPVCPVVSENLNSALKIAQVYVAPTTTTIVFAAGTIGLAASTAYVFSFQCIG